MKKLSAESAGPGATRAIGRAVGSRLESGDVVALRGPLGAGKTTLAKGLAAGLGVAGAETEVSSPTFALIHEYDGRQKVYHLDWYRLDDVSGPDEGLAAECFSAHAVTLVEWPERGAGALPKERLEIALAYRGEPASPAGRPGRRGDRGRTLELRARGARFERLLDEIARLRHFRRTPRRRGL